MQIFKSTAIFLALTGLTTTATAKSFPDNDLHLEDDASAVSNISKSSFSSLTEEVMRIYRPLATKHGGKLTLTASWKSPEVNATAIKSRRGTWLISIYGGLARRKEMTKDGFSLVMCHELGHLFGGFPFRVRRANGTSLASEGGADYFATHVCAKKLWKNQKEKNAKFASKVDSSAKRACKAKYSGSDDRNLCYRIAAAGMSVAKLHAGVARARKPSFGRKDNNVVSRTDTRHPDAQCRLDTFMAGVACERSRFDDYVIPGDKYANNGQKAEKEAYRYSCARSRGDSKGLRPTCWFKPTLR